MVCSGGSYSLFIGLRAIAVLGASLAREKQRLSGRATEKSRLLLMEQQRLALLDEGSSCQASTGARSCRHVLAAVRKFGCQAPY